MMFVNLHLFPDDRVEFRTFKDRTGGWVALDDAQVYVNDFATAVRVAAAFRQLEEALRPAAAEGWTEPEPDGPVAA